MAVGDSLGKLPCSVATHVQSVAWISRTLWLSRLTPQYRVITSTGNEQHPRCHALPNGFRRVKLGATCVAGRDSRVTLSQEEAALALESLYRMETSAHVLERPLSPYSAAFGKTAEGVNFLLDTGNSFERDVGRTNSPDFLVSHTTSLTCNERAGFQKPTTCGVLSMSSTDPAVFTDCSKTGRGTIGMEYSSETRLPGPRKRRIEASGQLSEQGTAPARVVVIDNYDSFTYNLCQYLGDLGCQYEVFRNDELTIDELQMMKPRGVLISPGPGTPEDSGISLDVVRQLAGQVPIFGVCMGLQCMGQAFGGRIIRAPGGVMHGKTSMVFHNQLQGDGLLGGLPSPFVACRYHSLVIERETFPSEQLEITAWTADGLIMGVRHRKHSHLEGVQFHPESIITENGKLIVANFVQSMEQHERACSSQT